MRLGLELDKGQFMVRFGLVVLMMMVFLDLQDAQQDNKLIQNNNFVYNN